MVSILLALKATPMIFAALFPVVNPIGTALILFGMTRQVDDKVWKATAKKISLYSFFLLTFFLLFGGFILHLFGISIPVVQLSGGMVLAFMGWNLLSQNESAKPAPETTVAAAATALDTRVFYPYTFPITIGPGCLAVVMTFSAHLDGTSMLYVTLEQAAAIFGIFAISVVTYLCYSNLKFITKSFPPSAALAISRILAFFILCIGVQIAWTGFEALQARLG